MKYFRQYVVHPPLLVASIGFVSALILAPLARSLPEYASIAVFLALFPLSIVCGIAGALLNLDAWRRARHRVYVIGLVCSLLVFIILWINMTTAWLWPYAAP